MLDQVKCWINNVKKRVSDLEDVVANLPSEVDNQVISLTGNTLTLSDGLVPDSIVDLSAYENQTITPVLETMRVVYASGRTSNNAGATVLANNSTVTRTAAGRYTVSFSAPHPEGVAYEIVMGAQSDEPNRDQRKFKYTNVTANGFDVVTTVDDNGGTADGYADIPFSYAVFYDRQVVTNVTVV